MRKQPLLLHMPESIVSEGVWKLVYTATEEASEKQRADFLQAQSVAARLRAQATHDTGSITLNTALGLFGLARLFRPTYIIEIGTFIGRSTMAIAHGRRSSRGQGQIYTCDKENAVALPNVPNCTIHQFHRTLSTVMLKAMISQGIKADMIFIDGTLQPGDVDLLCKLSRPQTIVALDDFVGLEKGVSNALKLRDGGLLEGTRLIPPPAPRPLDQHPLRHEPTTALLLPKRALKVMLS